MGFGSILSIGAGLLGGLGGGKDTKSASAPQGGFETLPQPVKDAYLQTYLPDVLKDYAKPREPIPLGRATAPTTPFDSQELYRLQQFSDAVGGYFSPMDKTLQEVYNPQPTQVPTDPAAASAADGDYAAQFFASLPSNAYTSSPTWGYNVGNAQQLFRGASKEDKAKIGKIIKDAGGLSGDFGTINNKLVAAGYGYF